MDVDVVVEKRVLAASEVAHPVPPRPPRHIPTSPPRAILDVIHLCLHLSHQDRPLNFFVDDRVHVPAARTDTVGEATNTLRLVRLFAPASEVGENPAYQSVAVEAASP